MRWLRNWWPALLWAAVISIASMRWLSSEHTGHTIFPILRWIFPHASHATLELIHHLIRKGGHVFEYALFSLLVLRGFRAGHKGWRWTWAGWTILIVACYALLDEFHQLFVPGRGASVWDSALDTAAGATALLLAWLVISWRENRQANARPS
jgi:VanZ family protein